MITGHWSEGSLVRKVTGPHPNTVAVNVYRFWRSRGFDLMSQFQDGSHDVISCTKVLPLGEWTQSGCAVPIWSSVRHFPICEIRTCSDIRPV